MENGMFDLGVVAHASKALGFSSGSHKFSVSGQTQRKLCFFSLVYYCVSRPVAALVWGKKSVCADVRSCRLKQILRINIYLIPTIIKQQKKEYTKKRITVSFILFLIKRFHFNKTKYIRNKLMATKFEILSVAE